MYAKKIKKWAEARLKLLSTNCVYNYIYIYIYIYELDLGLNNLFDMP